MTDHLNWVLSDFSGFIAADKLYDGPFCILSFVDNRTFKRHSYHLLNRVPTAKEVETFFSRFHTVLKARGLTVPSVGSRPKARPWTPSRSRRSSATCPTRSAH